MARRALTDDAYRVIHLAVAAEQITRDHFMSVIAALRQLEEVKAQHPRNAL